MGSLISKIKKFNFKNINFYSSCCKENIVIEMDTIQPPKDEEINIEIKNCCNYHKDIKIYEKH